MLRQLWTSFLVVAAPFNSNFCVFRTAVGLKHGPNGEQPHLTALGHPLLLPYTWSENQPEKNCQWLYTITQK